MELTAAKKVAMKAVDGSKATVVGFWRGLTYPFKGLKFIFYDHPTLVRFWVFPIFITGALLAAIASVGWTMADRAADAILGEGGVVELLKVVAEIDKAKPIERAVAVISGPAWYDGLLDATHGVVWFVIMVLIWAAGLMVVVLFSNVIAAPFNDLLSEEVERLATGKAGPPLTLKILLRDLFRTLGLETVKLAIYFVVMGPLFLISLAFPAVGQVIYSIFGFVFTAAYFAIDYVDWPASRRNRGLRYRFRMLVAHAMPMMGFGTGVWVFLFVPIVNLVFMPAAVAGGTLLYLELEGPKPEPNTGS